MTPVPVHKAAAIGLFRTSVFFVFAIAAFAERDSHTQTLLLTIVFLLDVISWHICEVTNINGHLVYNQTWFNVLADRFILEKLLDRLRDRQHVDFQEITKEGTKAAAADVSYFWRKRPFGPNGAASKKLLLGSATFFGFGSAMAFSTG
jgi:hypothetical protein